MVVSNSRGPETLADLVEELGDGARAGTAAEAAAAGDIVVVTVPLKAYREVPGEPLAGKVVIDTNNYYPQRDGQHRRARRRVDDRQRAAPGPPAGDPRGQGVQQHQLRDTSRRSPGRTAIPSAPRSPIAGDDDAAKKTVTDLLDDLGYDALDAGDLSEGWRFQRDTAAYGLYAGPGGLADPRRRTADEVRAKLDEAKRYRDM